ncbi:chromosome partition protein Smc [Mycoplasma sp. CAG:956]|nr:chromosome partition protein Smc [Mycoplasma sp. CAG:956]
MYLKSIKAVGFKSFADKIELDIKDGITCIVGPNGSGKSNILDAVKWVLGEQSVKTLRGTGSMSDVIFNGSKSRSPMSRASVALTIDNSNHYLKSEFNEIEVKRVVYRTGENEYYLNNAKVRLKDITDLFIDSGASRDAYNIISQGTVEDIVNSKPEARRVIIEEAAGVLKYKKHKEESLRKLEKTKDNLNTINLLISELETSLEPLRIQSIKAKKFNEYKDNLKNLEIALIVNDIKKINLEYNKLKARNEELKSLIEELTAKINKDTATLEVSKLSNLEVESTLNKLNQNLVELERQIADTNAKKTMILERKKLNSNNDATLNNVLNLKEEILSIGKNINSLEDEIKALNSKKDELKTTLDSIDNEELILRKNYVTESNEYNRKNKELLELNNKIDILNNNILNEVNIPLPVKSILNNPRLKGIYNTVGKLLTFDDAYMNAIETTLGASINYLVVDSETSVKQAINYLKEQRLGRATFLPLNIIKPKYLDSNIIDSLKNTSGFIDTAINLVKYDKAYDNIMQNLLATTIIVKDIDALNSIAKHLNYKYKVVSLDGDISYAGGSISGGAKKNSNSILKDRYELTKLETNKVNLETNIRVIDTKINTLNQEQEEIKNKKNKVNNEYIELKETINRKNISLAELQSNYKDKENTIKNNEAILNNTVDIELDNILKSYYELNGKKDNLLRTIKDYKEKLETARGDLAELELNIKNKNHSLNKYNSEFNSNEITLGKYDVKLDNYLLTLNEEYTMTYEKALHEIDTNIDIETTRLQVSKLKSSIKDLGEVNLGSIAEFERVNERYTFLTTQKDDLVKSIEELETAIASLDEIMKERFKATFASVNMEFQKVFKILFRGGEGHLELTDKDNLLETGVEIIAQPPGKKLSSITLFSGGERTLTAISLLFAILNVKTVPFVILDEVEAALDEANVDVFGKYLETRKDKSQFIIITHKKRTMEYADTLYGITMQEEGVSKLVSVRMEENKDN